MGAVSRVTRRALILFLASWLLVGFVTLSMPAEDQGYVGSDTCGDDTGSDDTGGGDTGGNGKNGNNGNGNGSEGASPGRGGGANQDE